MPRYDFRCEKCDTVWEDVVPASQVKDYPPECPECGSNFTKLVWLRTPSVDKAKDPYDMIDGAFNDGKKIYAGKYARSK
jgi:putative FmdB family regulatory protein